ncbi:hypothetical protein BTUL_0312g00060 [Botrytis tulipae]|uniref:Uncharacterized protein n=1 Tax=Botrytis tulipae TaxID=87230 RepID=A0A4Z1E9B8_9HELO|nr:hypothetical protein BTUL_0312g00060 [Botrytis tulipae]
MELYESFDGSKIKCGEPAVNIVASWICDSEDIRRLVAHAGSRVVTRKVEKAALDRNQNLPGSGSAKLAGRPFVCLEKVKMDEVDDYEKEVKVLSSKRSL